MPNYNFECENCHFSDDFLMQFSEHEHLPVHPEKKCRIMTCPKCGGEMHQIIGTTHTSIGRSWDGHNPGKVFQEHNDKLKKREGTGYDYLTPTQKIRERYLGNRFRNN